MLKKRSRNSDEDNDRDRVPDVRADDPEDTMERFAEGLKRVLATDKANTIKKARQRRQSR